ncbi:MAG: nicotinamide-nucleotide amidohydrolase family protein [Clostridia bacterium]|nr:nicotinamide-nucleotide amidohydrolase family protein [Clostridia bacterium]
MEILKQKCDEAVNALIDKRMKIATAESCTGGLVSSLITSVSGASAVFGLGVCSYSPTAKHEILKVSQSTLNAFGTVSEQTAKEMAENVRKIANADIGVSVTGVAGPNMSENKPVGLVYIALSDHNKTTVKKLNIKPQSRDFVRNSAAEEIFDLIINYLNSEENYAL